MNSEEELTRFVREALAGGASRDDVRAALRDAGWSDVQIHEALDGFAGVAFGRPVPRPRASSGARDAFVYGALFVALFVTAYSFGDICFHLIDQFFGEPSQRGLADRLRSPISVLVVSTPVFLLLNRLVAQETREDPNRRISEVRRKLTYLTLFISGAVLLGVVAGLVYSVLGGELPTTFVLKSIVVGGIAGIGFIHYLSEMRQEAPPGPGPVG